MSSTLAPGEFVTAWVTDEYGPGADSFIPDIGIVFLSSSSSSDNTSQALKSIKSGGKQALRLSKAARASAGTPAFRKNCNKLIKQLKNIEDEVEAATTDSPQDPPKNCAPLEIKNVEVALNLAELSRKAAEKGVQIKNLLKSERVVTRTLVKGGCQL